MVALWTSMDSFCYLLFELSKQKKSYFHWFHHCRNYNPVERRSRGGKEKSVKGSSKVSKSLQTNNTHHTPTVTASSKPTGIPFKLSFPLCPVSNFLNLCSKILTARSKASKITCNWRWEQLVGQSASSVKGGNWLLIIPLFIQVNEKKRNCNETFFHNITSLKISRSR